MTITAAMVKELRERTGSGMMECKKALVEANGDIDAAIEQMRKSGQAKADKKAGRAAAEGKILIRVAGDGSRGVMVEVNCETDFVTKDGNFAAFADAVVDRALAANIGDLESLLEQPLRDGDSTTIEAARKELIAKIGENIAVRRLVQFADAGGPLASYVHSNDKIGVLVELAGGDAELGRDIAMHVAAANPLCVSADQMPPETLAKEREIFAAQAAESGKPPNIIEKMVEGRVKKYLAEVTLMGQNFVKDPDTSVAKLLDGKGAKVTRFQRFQVGEGVEKKKENFAEEVMAQVQGA